MRLRKIILLYLLIAFCASGFAQQKKVESIGNTTVLRISQEFPNLTGIEPGSFFEHPYVIEQFSLPDEISFKIISEHTDRYEIHHIKFQEFYKGVKIEGFQVIIHKRSDGSIRTSGYLVQNLDVDVRGYVGEETARLKAHKLTATENIPQASGNQRGELIISRLEDKTEEKWTLMWKISVPNKTIYMDAKTGEVLKTKASSVGIDATATTLYNGVCTIQTSETGGVFRLEDNTRGGGIRTYETYPTPIEDPDNNNVWDDAGHSAAVSAHWALGESFDYFLNIHNWTYAPPSGHDTWINCQVSASSAIGQTDNGNGVIEFKNLAESGFTSGPAVSLETVAHEFSHNMTFSRIGVNFMTYKNENPALGEALADIFGILVDFHVQGSNANYIIGEDWSIATTFNGTTFERDLSNPSAAGYTDTYKGAGWSDLDQYGKSAFMSYWFYLLAEGGQGTNENGLSYTVPKIGRYAVGQIVFQAIAGLTENEEAKFEDARDETIQAAKDIYGPCSMELMSVALAWRAVGLSPTFDFGVQIVVDCNKLHLVHNINQQPYGVQAFTYLTSDCNALRNGQPIVFQAGTEIRLRNGFQSGDNFRAMITPCVTSNLRIAPPSSTDGGHESTELQSATANNMAGNYVNDKQKETEKRAYKSLRIYPNPSNGSVSLQGASIQQVFVYNTLGKQMLNKKINASNGNLNLAEFDNGIYLIKVETENTVETKKIVLNK